MRIQNKIRKNKLAANICLILLATFICLLFIAAILLTEKEAISVRDDFLGVGHPVAENSIFK